MGPMMSLNNDPVLQLCAFMAKADNFLKDEEIAFAKSHLHADAGKFLDSVDNSPISNSDIDGKYDVDALLATVSRFSKEKKIELLRLLWNLSICDAELHTNEEILFYKISDTIGISRRETIDITC